MSIKRRDLIKNSILASVGYSMLPNISFAQINQANLDNFFVQILVSGGMDVTLSLDPLMHSSFNTDDKDVFLEYRPEDILSHESLLLGPACIDLRKHMSSITTVNGIVMRRDIGHDPLLAYMASGSGGGDLPYHAIEAGNFLEDTTLGTLVNTSFSLGNRRPSLSQISEHKVFDGNTGSKPESIEALESIYKKTNNKVTKATYDMLAFNLQKQSFYDRIGSLSDEPQDREIIAAAFLENVASSAIIDLENSGDLDFDLDTHSDHEGRHIRNQESIWRHISGIFDLFQSLEYKNGSLYDHTTFCVVSEFSRTPYLNPAKGKDHNVFTNSVLLAGGRVNGGKSFGGSKVIPRGKRKDGRAIHIGSPFDYKAGQTVSESGENIGLIFPENVAKSLSQLIKSDRVYPGLRGVKQIPNLFK